MIRLASCLKTDEESPFQPDVRWTLLFHFNGAAAAFQNTRRRYFPKQNRLKIRPSKSSVVNAPVIVFSASCVSRNSSAISSG